VWRIQGYSRCSIHKLFLRTNCPHCGEHQNKHSRDELHLCCCCRQSLATQISKTEYAPRPEFGEAQIEALIENIRFISPGDTEPLRTFFGNIDGADDYVVKYLGDIFHTRRLPVRPQLSSLIAVATHFSVDVIQLMTDPRQAASQATLNIKKPPRNRSTRPSSHRRQKRTAWFKTQLELAIREGPPFPSTKEFCRRNDYSLSAARNTFPDLTSTLSGKHLDWKQSRANQLKARAMAAIADLSMSTSQLTIKEAVANVCTNTGAPVHVVRALIDASAFSLR